MKVIRTRVGALAASFGLLASALALTAVTAGSAVAGTVTVASGPAPAVCSNATVIEASACKSA